MPTTSSYGQSLLHRPLASIEPLQTPVLAGRDLKALTFSVLRLRRGQSHTWELPVNQEGVCILISGQAVFLNQGEQRTFRRRDVFKDLPAGIFLNPGMESQIRGEGDDETLLVIGMANVGAERPEAVGPQWIDPGQIEVFERGRSMYSRTIRNIVDEKFPSANILCGETLNPPGHWSSFPPHKHDDGRTQGESVHEEIYYYQFDRPGGWGYQEVYSPERGQSEVIRVESGDLVKIPFGYHPVVGAPGYGLYYFWILAGADRKLGVKEDPKHAWISERVHRPLRKIVHSLPDPKSSPLLKTLADHEATSMQGQPPVIWDRALGYQVFDPFGNVFLDFTSGVLVANCGHSHPRVQNAIQKEVERGLLTSYLFANQARASLVARLSRVAPEGLGTVALFCSGSEAIECCLKLARTWAKKTVGPRKRVVVSFERSFHGRTMGAQLAGGIPELKSWLEGSAIQDDFVQVPFPDGLFQKDLSFAIFEEGLRRQGVDADQVCAVIAETYQGGVVSFAPAEYMRDLRTWCDRNGALLVMDEVQAGFGRTGRWWGFEHYGITPDLIACGKGISSSLPLSAVLGTSEILNMYPPGSLSTTHSGNPLSCAAAAASLDVLEAEDLPRRARELEPILWEELSKLPSGPGQPVRAVLGKGLVFAIHLQTPEGMPAADLAKRVVWRAVSQGVLLFAPVGMGGATIKINPPLIIDEEAIRDGLSVVKNSIRTEARFL